LPLTWNDLKAAARPVFQVANFEEWKHVLKSNPWKDFPKTRQRLGFENRE